MPQHTWVFDAPSGTYKNHVLSERIYDSAIADTVFMDHVDTKTDLGKGKGETITWTRIKTINEPASARLSETERIPEDVMVISTASVTVDEWGRSLPYTSLSQDLTHFNLENKVQSKLKEQLAQTLDTAAAGAFKLAKIKYVPTGPASNNIAVNGTPGATATSNLNVFHVEEIADYMYDTLFVPYADGENYMGIFRTAALRGLKRDPQWEEWHKYTNPSAKENGEVGRIERVRFKQTNHDNALAKNPGASTVGLGEGVVFGKEAVILAEVMTPELRVKMAEDYGRSKGVAWYGIFEFAIAWDTGNAGEAKIVHVTSA